MHGVSVRPQTPVKNVVEGIFERDSESALNVKYKEYAAERKRHRSQMRNRHTLMHTKASIFTETFLADRRSKMM